MKSIVTKNLAKTYKGEDSIIALKHINLEVNRGELFGLIGPDGAGKTSLFRILTTLLLPDEGSAEVEGMDVVKDYKKIRKLVGYMPGKFSLYQDLSVKENLLFFATIFNTTIDENYDLIKDIYQQLEPFSKRRAGALSGGMKQKLALCCALIHRPKVLFLDEPTTGVDVVSRKEFWEMLHRLKEEGITIFVSTPYMDEASMCDRIALIQKGIIFSIDSPQNLINSFPHDLYAIKADNMYKLLQDLDDFPSTTRVYPFGEYHHVIFNKAVNVESDLKQYLTSSLHTSYTLKKAKTTVEDCFLDFMYAESFSL
jgi:ABC-type multidrug transport system ATPase subunit